MQLSYHQHTYAQDVRPGPPPITTSCQLDKMIKQSNVQPTFADASFGAATPHIRQQGLRSASASTNLYPVCASLDAGTDLQLTLLVVWCCAGTEVGGDLAETGTHTWLQQHIGWRPMGLAPAAFLRGHFHFNAGSLTLPHNSSLYPGGK